MTTNTPQETPIINGSLVSLDDSFSFCFSSVKGIKNILLTEYWKGLGPHISHRVLKWRLHKNWICEIKGFVKMFWKNNAHDVYWPKLSISGQIVSEIIAQLYSYESIQILVNSLGSKRWLLFFRNILTNPIISQIKFFMSSHFRALLLTMSTIPDAASSGIILIS